MSDLFTRFRGARSGATAVEFGFVAPLFIMLLIEIFQGGLYVFCYAAIEKATADAARSVMIGSLDSDSATAAGFRSSNVCANLLGGLSCDNVVTSLQSTTMNGAGTGYGSFVNSAESALVDVSMNNGQNSYCTGAPGTYQYLQVFYAVPVFSPIWTLANSTNWNGRTVVFARASAAFRNEPFTSASVSSGC